MSDLTPDEEAEVTRMLRDLPQIPMPDEVRSRLDDTLAGLVAEREEGAPSNVVPLRRRTWPKVLVAAAAVSLFGYVGSNFVQTQSADDASGGATSAAPEDAAGGDDGEVKAQDAAPPRVLEPSTDAAPGPTSASEVQKLTALVDLANASRYSRASGVLPTDGLVRGQADYDQRAYKVARDGRCDRPALAKGEQAYEVPLGKRRAAVVVLRPLTANSSQVDVYPCNLPILPIGSTLVLGLR